MERAPIDEPLATGIRVIDGLLPCGKGQRIGIFGGSGVGKSTLLGSMARSSSAAVNVIAFTLTQAAPPPGLSISKSHSGNFTQGQQNATYTITVSNAANAGPTSGTVTVAETAPSGLTLVSMAGTGWTCTTLPTCTTGTVLAGGQSYSPIAVKVNVNANATSPQVNQVSLTGGGSAAVTATDSTLVNSPTVNVIVLTSPAGLAITVDNAPFTAPQTFSWTPGSQHVMGVSTPQAGPSGSGTQYAFTSWSDSGAASHTITVGSSAATYTATFATQYLLTTTASPASGGSVNANPSSASGYYNAGTGVQLTATAGTGFQFSNWSGALSGSTNPQSLTMNAASSVTANFTTTGTSCSFTLSPPSSALPTTGTSTVETCPNNSGQPNCGVLPETPVSFTVTPSAGCGAWMATSSNPGFLQITSGASGSGSGAVSFVRLNNTHTGSQSDTITVATGTASATYSVTEAGSGDNQVYREIYALYEQFLGRDPDPAGFAFWTGSGGAGLGQMADSFLTSPEAYDTDFAVIATYQAATAGPPTFTQYNAAASAIRAGAQTIPGLFNALIGVSYSATNLYQNLLNRAPGAGDSSCTSMPLANCFQAIIGYPSNTTPVGAANNEFQSTGSYHTDHTNGLYVQMIYYVTLSRDPDPAGLAFWTGIANSSGPGLLFQGNAGFATRIQILGPGTVGQGFIGSPEFQGLFAN